MDSSTVFVRTTKGEDEAQSRTVYLPGDIKRALLVVDGTATYGELSKRAAPSLRAGLGAMLEELERDGYIRDKLAAARPHRKAYQPKMVVPKKTSAPPKPQATEERTTSEDSGGDLDFLTGFAPAAPQSQEARAPQPTAGDGLGAETGRESKAALWAREETAARLREVEREQKRISGEAQAREEVARRVAAEAAAVRARQEQALKARQEAEAVRKKAEQEAFRQREAADARSKAEGGASGTFAFDAFQLEESLPIQASHEPVGERKVAAPETGSEGKAGTFRFDAFQVEPSQQQRAAPARGSGSQERGGARAAGARELPQRAQREVAFAMSETSSSEAGPSDAEIERATQERIATERRLEEKALAAKKQAEAQAKAHAESRKRAEETARAQFAQAASNMGYAERAPSTAKATRVVRGRRESITLGRVLGFMVKAGFALALLLLGILFAMPYLLPTQDYIPRVEKFLSAKLGQPVRIGRLYGRVVPTPRLELGEVQIGGAKQLEAEQVLVDFSFRGLVIEAKPVNKIEFRGARVTGAGLQKVSAWMQGLAEDIQYPVAGIMFTQGSLNAGVVQLIEVEGTLNFDQIGGFTKGSLNADGGKYVLDMTAGKGSRLDVNITVRGSALPLLPRWHFDELTAKGELSSRGLSISEFHGRMLDGFLQGKASIDWRSGWSAQGSLVAKTISMHRLNKLLEGNLDGSGRFRMSSGLLDALADSPVWDGSFSSRKGVIHGLDVIETARTHRKGYLPGGRTHYDELSGSVDYARDGLHLKHLRIRSSVLDATATLNIHGQQVSGSAVAELSLERGMKPVTLRIDGSIEGPALRWVSRILCKRDFTTAVASCLQTG